MGLNTELFAVGPFNTSVAAHLEFPSDLYLQTKPGALVYRMLHKADFTSATLALQECFSSHDNRIDANGIDLNRLKAFEENFSRSGEAGYWQSVQALRDEGFSFFLSAELPPFADYQRQSRPHDQLALAAFFVAFDPHETGPAFDTHFLEACGNELFGSDVSRQVAKSVGIDDPWDFNGNRVTRLAGEDLNRLLLEIVKDDAEAHFGVRRDAPLLNAWLRSSLSNQATVLLVPGRCKSR